MASRREAVQISLVRPRPSGLHLDASEVFRLNNLRERGIFWQQFHIYATPEVYQLYSRPYILRRSVNDCTNNLI